MTKMNKQSLLSSTHSLWSWWTKRQKNGIHGVSITPTASNSTATSNSTAIGTRRNTTTKATSLLFLVMLTGCNLILIFYNVILYDSRSSNNSSETSQHKRIRTLSESYSSRSSDAYNNRISSKSDDEEYMDKTWCPYASTNLCYKSTLNIHCIKPCHERYLLILATARSASTTMRQMLNQLPGTRIGGENNNALHRVYNFLYNIDESQHTTGTLMSYLFSLNGTSRLEPNDKFHLSWGHYPIYIDGHDMTCLSQQLLNALNPPPIEQRHDMLLQQRQSTNRKTKIVVDDTHTIKGFKEVRVTENHTETAQELVEKINLMLPCNRIVINYNSNIESEIKSQLKLGWYSPLSDEEATIQARKDILRSHNKLMDIAQVTGSKQTFVFDSSMYKINQTHALEKMNELVKWLGYSDCHFNELLHANSNGSYNVNTKKINLGPNCHYTGDWKVGAY